MEISKLARHGTRQVRKVRATMRGIKSLGIGPYIRRVVAGPARTFFLSRIAKLDIYTGYGSRRPTEIAPKLLARAISLPRRDPYPVEISNLATLATRQVRKVRATIR